MYSFRKLGFHPQFDSEILGGGYGSTLHVRIHLTNTLVVVVESILSENPWMTCIIAPLLSDIAMHSHPILPRFC